jgi:protein subunit release factor A
MKRVIEIRSAEGGADSQLFVKDLFAAYVRLIDRKG